MLKVILLRKFLSGIILFLLICCASIQSNAQQPTGLGIVRPLIKEGTTLYLYSGQLIDDLLHHKTIKDSITFIVGKYNVEIGTAPPWFAPEYLKLDYEILQLRAITIARNWIEVIVNKKTGQTAWVDKNAVSFEHWPDFLLGVYGVEVMNSKLNPVRIKPLDNASIVVNPGNNSLRPIAV